MDIRKLCLLCLSFLSALGVYAQAEQKDSTVQDNKGVLITLTDGIATTVRHTGRKIRKVGKEFNAVDIPGCGLPSPSRPGSARKRLWPSRNCRWPFRNRRR